MRIAYIAAGAGGMYCGTCIHDNTLAAALMRKGHEVALLPTYTPMRTDEEDVSSPRVFYGAVNVYLETKLPFLRRVPGALDWLFNRRRVLDWVSRLGAATDARDLGQLALDVLRGEEGPQARELERLVGFLADEYRPDIVVITNSLFLGLVRTLKERLGAPVVVAVQGEDLFLDTLPVAYRDRALAEMRQRAGAVDAFSAPSRYYADHMAALLGVDRGRFAVVPLGIRLEGHDRALGERPPGAPLAVGYLARICPEKGLHLLVEAFRRLADSGAAGELRLRVAGYLGAGDRAYHQGLRRELEAAGLAARCDWVGEVDREQKIDFLRSLDLFSVPTVYREPKGLFLLEAMANGLPVVAPDHGSFPEMLAATGGGVLVEPNSAAALAAALAALATDRERRQELGRRGRQAVLAGFGEGDMAAAHLELFERLLEGGASPGARGAAR